MIRATVNLAIVASVSSMCAALAAADEGVSTVQCGKEWITIVAHVGEGESEFLAMRKEHIVQVTGPRELPATTIMLDRGYGAYYRYALATDFHAIVKCLD